MITVDKMQSLHGRLSVDGDKSITIRAILLSLISSGSITVDNALIGADTLAAIDCVRRLGVKVVRRKNSLRLYPASEIAGGVTLDCKNSATLARLLIGILCGAGITATVTGDESLSVRPMGRVVEPLRQRGAIIEDNCGKLPVKIYPARLTDAVYTQRIGSAQVKSALLLSGCLQANETLLTNVAKSRNHTEVMLSELGVKTVCEGDGVTCLGGRPSGGKISVPGDPSSAAFYLALGLLLGEISVPNVLITHSRAGFFKKIEQSGGIIEYEKNEDCGVFERATVTVKRSNLDYFEVDGEELPTLIDEVPILALLGAKNNGCIFRGAGELRVKESDRLSQTVRLIELAGGSARVSGDDLVVSPGLRAKPFEYESSDHRMLMTAFVAMASGEGGRIAGEQWIAVSFPSFLKNLNENRLALVGADLSRSLSGRVHKSVLTSFGVKNFAYELYEVDEHHFDEFIKKCPYKAINVTFPYKKSAVFDAFIKSDGASRARSVNYLYDGKCYTTDGLGVIYSLGYNSVELCKKRVLVYGAGGAGASVAVALAKIGAEVLVANRSKWRIAELLAANGDMNIKEYDGGAVDIIVNCATDCSSVDWSNVIKGGAVFALDINYAKPSHLLDECKKAGLSGTDGMQTLFFQAYIADCTLLKKAPSQKEAFQFYKEYIGRYGN